ncbi:hypothetical protein [Brevundimonas naejangsanensis]
MTRSDFLLSTQRALLGFITANVRSVSGNIEGQTISIRYIIDGEIDEETREELSCASTEVIADMAWDWSFEEQFVRLDAPASLRGQTLPLLAYERFEPAQ